MCYSVFEVSAMTISDKNTRTNITLSKELKAELAKKAKEQNRSFNNLIVTILSDYLKLAKK